MSIASLLVPTPGNKLVCTCGADALVRRLWLWFWGTCGAVP